MQRRPDGKPEKETMHKGLSGTVCRRTLREDGVSDAVGAMLLITIIAMGISIFVVGVVLQPVDPDPPVFTFNVSYGPEGEVYIRHLGGESVSKDLLHVYIADGEGGETAEDVQYLLEINDSTAWNTWHIGETLVYSNPSCTEPPEVAMTYADQSGTQYLYYASYNWTGTIPAATPGVPPTAGFTASPTSGTAPLSVQFTDISTGGPTSWSWNFGDGGTSTLQNPSHTYAAAGTYTVTLTATNAVGSDTKTKVGYVTVTELQPPVVTTITPDFGESGTIVSITNLAGTNFQNGATIKLTKSGETDIHATGVTFVSSTQITCSFNLAGAATGRWNIIVTNPDTQSGTLSNGFEVTAAQIYKPVSNLTDELALWTTSGDIVVGNYSGYSDVVQMTSNKVDSSMSRNLSTAGYENITVSFSLAAVGFKNKDEAVVEWFDSTSWHELLHIRNKDPLGDQQFHKFPADEPYYFLLPSADNNPDFAIRFRLMNHGGTSSALVDLKNLKVTGDPI